MLQYWIIARIGNDLLCTANAESLPCCQGTEEKDVSIVGFLATNINDCIDVVLTLMIPIVTHDNDNCYKALLM